MKNLIVLLLLLTAKIASAQQKDTVGLNTPFVNGEVVYQKTFKASDKSSDQLFSNAKLWFVKHSRNSDNIQILDEPTGRIVGSNAEQLTFKGILGLDASFDTNMVIQIDCKNGRYRARIFNIVIKTEDANNVKSYIYAEQIMNNLAGIKTNITLINSVYPFSKNQSKRALQSLNILIDNVMASIDQTMNDSDNF